VNTGLFQYRTQGTARHIRASVTGDSDRAGLGQVSELTMTTARPHKMPTLLFKQVQRLAHFHRETLPVPGGFGRSRKPGESDS
jgi:hypothetical protein